MPEELDNLNWKRIEIRDLHIYHQEEYDLAALGLPSISKLLNIDIATLYVCLKSQYFMYTTALRTQGDKTPVILHARIETLKGEEIKRIVLEKDLCLLSMHYGFKSNIKNKLAQQFATHFMRSNFKLFETLEKLKDNVLEEDNLKDDNLRDLSCFFNQDDVVNKFNNLNKILEHDFNFKLSL